MQAKGMSQCRLAHILSVAPSTISRLTRGKLGTTHKVDARLICNVLDLTEMDRRTFFTLAAQACVLPLAFRACPEHLRFHPFERSIGRSLEEIEDEIALLRERRNRGEVAVVYQLAGELFDKLFNSSVPATRVAKSPELAHAKLLVGFELCEVQAAHLGWYARTDTMIRTLNRIEKEVLLQFPPKVFASEHNRLLNLRGPLYYKLPCRTNIADSYLESIDELTTALNNLMSLHYEPTLRVELLRNRAHAYLLHGPENERKWRADLDAARHVAAAISTDERENFQALVEYSWGEGYRKLEYRSGIPSYARKLYMNEAIRLLSQSGAIFQQHYRWKGYALLAEIAEAHCVVWQDADEALLRLDHLRTVAQQFYPALLAKIERIATVAEREKTGRSATVLDETSWERIPLHAFNASYQSH
jgi:transcriptional regulator with XRE-family HTH domain